MKKILLPVYALAAGLLFGFTACSEDNASTLDTTASTTTTDLPTVVVEELYAKYPTASNVTWTTQDEYYVVSFYLASTRSTNDTNNTAWFNKSSGAWGMTKTKILYSALPEAVKTAYEATEYGMSGSAWTTDQTVDYLQRPDGSEDIYVIEAEKKESGVETEVELYYTEAGVLVKEIIDAETESDHKEYLPQSTDTSITQWLESNFPNATIIEIDAEDGTTEVELINNGLKVDVLFDSSKQWVYTKTEYDRNGLSLIPDVVLTTLRSSAYYTSDYAIDDADMYETRDNGTYYAFELETGNDNEVKLYIDAQGNLISKPQNSTSSSSSTTTVSVASAIQEFLDEKYPGATILEKEYDDGYLEVEIRHENIRKSVKFNGSNEWVKSDWDVTTLPEAVTAAITAGGYQITDNEYEYEESPTYAWYEVEVRKQGIEYDLYISAEGEILKSHVDN